MKNEAPFEVAGWIREHLDLLSPPPRSVVLFGSTVRGKTRPESDIDLLLVGNKIPQKPSERARWVYPLVAAWRKEGLSQRSLAPLILTETGWLDSSGLRLSVAEEGWILSDDGFISDSLEEARRWIQEGHWSRKPVRDGGWLWIPHDRPEVLP